MNTRLSAAIESLLRREGRAPLGPGRARDPVLGALTVVPPTGEQVLLPPNVWLAGVRIESGLLCLPQMRVDIEYPVVLAAPAWLVAWTAGSGIAVPDADPERTTLLLGQVRTDPALIPPIDWPDGADWPGRLYVSEGALSAVLAPGVAWAAAAYPPGLYAGEARLYAEACIGTGRSLAERLPVDCVSWYGALGVLWGPPDVGTDSPRMWLASIGSSGLRVWPMGLSEAGIYHARWVWAGDLGTGAAARLAIALAMSTARPISGEPSWLLLDADDMAPLYGGGGPVAHGWHWAWTPAWDPEVRTAGAAVITCTEATETGWISRAGDVSIAWTETDGVHVPSAILTIGVDEPWGGASAYLQIPDGTGRANTLPWGYEYYGADATVYRWTTPAGVQDLVRLASTAPSGTTTTGSAAWPSWYGTGEGETTYQVRTSLGTGGWAVRGPAAVSAAYDGASALDRTVRNAGVTAAGSWQKDTSSVLRIDVSAGGGYHTGAAPSSANCNSGGSIAIQFGAWTTAIQQDVCTGGSAGAGAAILGEDTGVALGRYQVYTSARRYAAERQDDRSVGTLKMVVGCTSPSGTATYISGAGVHLNVLIARTRTCVGGGASPPYEWSDGGSDDAHSPHYQGYDVPTLPSSYTDLPNDIAVWAVLSDGAPARVIDANEWSHLLGVCEDRPLPAARCSYSGLAATAIQSPTAGWDCDDPAIPSGTVPVAWAVG